MKKQIGGLFLFLVVDFAARCHALSAGDVMVVGYDSKTAPVDTVSLVTWTEIAPGGSILVMDADYDGGGDGSGEGTGGGKYGSVSSIVWSNSTDRPIPAGTVIVIPDMLNPSATIGTATGSIGLTVAGEQFFLAQGTLVADGSKYYLDGQLLFGVDYEGEVGWGESGESELPGALDVPNGNLSFGHVSAYEFQGPRNGRSFAEFRTDIGLSAHWSAPTASATLSAERFQTEEVPVVQVPDRFGAVSPGWIFKALRLNGGLPIIDEAWMTSQGATLGETDNMNGPSCVRIPDWVPAEARADPTAVYYLYFAKHSGNFIRLAWAADLSGPWTAYHLSSALPLQDRGVLSLGTSDTISPGNGIVLDGHIASPQVLIDDVNQQFVMYYHAPAEHNGTGKGQSTVVATSADGLNFNLPSEGGQVGHGTRPVILGESYFRVFEQDGDLYAFSNTGDIWKAPDPLNPYTPPGGYDYAKDYWKRGPNPFVDVARERGWPELRPRHFAVLKRENILYSFLTHKVDTPERVMVATFDFDSLPANYTAWTFRFPEQEVLRAASDWEGAQFPPVASEPGAQNSGVNQLRDPEVFEDSDGRLYLFYCGQGEDAIGLAQLVTAPEVEGTAEVDRGQAQSYTVETGTDVMPSGLRISHAGPATLDFAGETPGLPFTYSGNGSYPVLQSQMVASGTHAFQLAHLGSGERESLTFPDLYYARPGAALRFRSRLGLSTLGQVARIQVSFDHTFWETIWIQLGGDSESTFRLINLDLDGLVGRTFSLRFLYEHELSRSSNFVSGSGAGQGWAIDDVTASGLESVQVLHEQAWTTESFTLADLNPWISPFLVDGTGEEDRFLVSVQGAHTGEPTGFGKPFVIRIRTRYEQFQEEYFTEAEQADPALSGAEADFDGDGIINVLEHVFASDPRQPSHGLVAITRAAGAAPVGPQVTFPWNPDADYAYQLQMSPDLHRFDDIPFTQNISTNGGRLHIRLEPDLGAGSAEDAAFFRLRIRPE